MPELHDNNLCTMLFVAMTVKDLARLFVAAVVPPVILMQEPSHIESLFLLHLIHFLSQSFQDL